MIYSGEDCTRPIVFVEWAKVAAGVDTGYFWYGLMAGYLLTLVTVIFVVAVLNWRANG